MKKILGLDLGISSCGWCLMNKNDNGQFERIEDLSVLTFTEMENKGKLKNQERREKRGIRRQRRRKVVRKLDAKKMFLKYFEIDFEKIDFSKYENPYLLKIKGLTQQLTKEELMIALYHYIKYRGFKSNRKADDKQKEGKLLKRLSEVSDALNERKITATQFLIEELEKKEYKDRKIHNSDKTFLFNMTREMYVDEVTKVLDTQIKYNVINKEFKEEYLTLFERQRSFSEGPSKFSPYRGVDENGNPISLISKMIGVCQFDGLSRAPKGAYSSEKFVLLSFLNNFQYKENYDGVYKSLTQEDIERIYQLALHKKELKYKDIVKVLDVDSSNIIIKGLELSRKADKNVQEKIKQKYGLKNDRFNIEQYEEYKLEAKTKLLNQSVKSLSNFLEQKTIFEKELKKHKSDDLKKFIENFDNFDIVSELLLRYKTDNEIINECKKIGYSEIVINTILMLPSITKTINLSLPICKKVNEKMLKGMTYDKAMSEIGYNHSSAHNIEKYKLLPSIDECVSLLQESLRNPVVRHSLVEMRKIINEIILQYGEIDEIHIEFARELAKNFEDRQKIKSEQKDNFFQNNKYKEQLLLKYPNRFKSFKDISSEDILKYKLYFEQNCKCAYSNKIISETDLFSANATQIDHIMPFSKTFENRSFNKVLVLTKYNQMKGNQLPYEAFSKDQIEKMLAFINDPEVKISNKKKETLLLKKLPPQSEFVERNLNDTKYMAVLAKKIIENILKIKVVTVNGRMTDIIKKSYGLVGLTHSYVSANYKKPKDYIILSNTFAISSKKISCVLENIDTKQKVDFEINHAEAKKNKELSENEKAINEIIHYFNLQEIRDRIIQEIQENHSVILKIQQILANKFENSDDINNNVFYENQIKLFTLMQNRIDEEILTKDRTNDLHHALDASIIAICDASMIQKISKFYQLKENPIDENGVVIINPKLELPYNDYRNELMYRVYERNNDELIKKLSQLSNYNDFKFDQSQQYVMYPVKEPKKITKGALFKETILGIRENKYIVKRVSVSKLDIKNLDNIYQKDSGNQAVRYAVEKWLKEDVNSRTQYPILPHKGTYIKKVLIVESKDLKSRVSISENNFFKGYAENDLVVRVDVYKSEDENDHALYMVPIYLHHLKRNENSNTYTLMWAQGTDNKKYVNKDELNNKYQLYLKLYRYSLVEIEMLNGAKCLCYCGGVTSGMLEIYSIIGDMWDIYKNKISETIVDRKTITISTIKDIKLKHISLLGKIR